MKNQKLSVVLATFNEEKNLQDCLNTVRDLASEIVIVDGSSTDKTVDIAKKFNARIVITKNHPIFHINKQKALELAKNEWILQLDADERVTPELASEIGKVIAMSSDEIENYEQKIPDLDLFKRHQKLLGQRDGSIGTDSKEYAAFFIPRLNFFLGKYLHYGGVYPDGVIRLVKRNKTYFPCKDVHEQIVVNGKVGWIKNPLLHYDSPTFKRYLQRNSRYINLIVTELGEKKLKLNLLNMLQYMLILPTSWLVMTFGRHKGFKDGWRGFVFSFFSAMRFPRAYWRYSRIKK